MQCVTAVALAPLLLWFTLSLATLVGADHAHATAWLRSPLNAALMIAMLVAMFHHAYLGLGSSVDEYVHHHGLKVAALLLLGFTLAVLALLALLAVARVYLGG